MTEMQTTFINGFYLRSSKGYSGKYIAWCKREPFTGSDPINESGDVWFEFGSTRADAITNLWRSFDYGRA